MRAIRQTSVTQIKNSHGFTLLEMMVALMIFALLSLAGQQVFDNLNKSKERGKHHADALSELQYAYLQVQNDMSQVVAWQTIQLIQNADSEGKSNQNSDIAKEMEEVNYEPIGFFEMSPSSLSFLRFADPDPRYQSSPILLNVNYQLEGETLVRRQYLATKEGKNVISSTSDGQSVDGFAIDTILLSNVDTISWQAFLPEPVSKFSSSEISSQVSNMSDNDSKKQTLLLPKGIGMQFSYGGELIEWQFSLPKQSPALDSEYQIILTDTKDKRNDQSSDDGQKGNGEGSKEVVNGSDEN